MTATISETPVSVQLTYRGLVSDQLWERLVNRIVKDEDMERSLAERIMDQALGFLKFGADHPDQSFSPSPLVDIGWHTFILYTREYMAFCQRVAGAYIHHSPNDIPGAVYEKGAVQRTVVTLRANDFVLDEALWTAKADCTADRDCSSDKGDTADCE